MNIIEMVERYESLQNEYNEAEQKASDYEKRYDEMANIGYSEEDSYTHEMAICWSSYEDKMEKIEEKMKKYDISDGNVVAKELIKEFNKIEINTLMAKLSDWFNTYGDGTEIFTQPLFFLHSEEYSRYDDMVNYNYMDDFKWDIKKNEYFIVLVQDMYNQTPSITSYNQKDFFEWLEKELSMYDWWDAEVTEELETIIQVIHPNYYHFNW